MKPSRCVSRSITHARQPGQDQHELPSSGMFSKSDQRPKILYARAPAERNISGSPGIPPSTVLVEATKVGKISFAPPYKWRRTYQRPKPKTPTSSPITSNHLIARQVVCRTTPTASRPSITHRPEWRNRDGNYPILADGGKIKIGQLARGSHELLLKELAVSPVSLAMPDPLIGEVGPANVQIWSTGIHDRFCFLPSERGT